MGEVKEYRKKHWVGLDADKANLISPEDGDSYFANDKSKLYYWTGAAWKTGLGYEFVPRSAIDYDFLIGDLVVDGTWKVDGLDLSGIVPVGAVAVMLHCLVSDDAANTEFSLRANAVTKVSNTITLRTQVANISLYGDFVILCDSDRLLDYYASVGMVSIGVTVVGWFI